MQVVFHIGAHFTEEDRLLKCLLRNAAQLDGRTVAVPKPARYHWLMGGVLNAVENVRAASDAGGILLGEILEGARPERLVLSFSDFFSPISAAIVGAKIYPRASDRIANMVNLLRPEEVVLFVAIRNPASFLPTIYQRVDRRQRREMLAGVNPRSAQWSRTFEQVQEALPQARIVTWCNEDAPLLWGEIIRQMLDLPQGQEVEGALDLLGDIIAPEGMTTLQQELALHPGSSPTEKRKMMARQLEAHGLEHEMLEELDMPGWTDELVNEMTEIYEADVALIETMPNICVLSP